MPIKSDDYIDITNSNNNGSNFKKLVCFDLDGTLIKGIRHSWTLLWQAIGKDRDFTTGRKKQFENNEITYQEWCERDFNDLKKGELTLEKVKQAVSNSRCTLTKNFVPAMQKLKNNNCVVALISGGADCVLYCFVPNAKELFDEIFINKFIFNEKTGIIERIEPTHYDWDDSYKGVCGKNGGLKELCIKYRIPLEHSVFVGDDRNDFRAMETAGMRIFYHSSDKRDPTRGTGSKRLPDNLIFEQENNLMKIADRIINWSFDDD